MLCETLEKREQAVASLKLTSGTGCVLCEVRTHFEAALDEYSKFSQSINTTYIGNQN